VHIEGWHSPVAGLFFAQNAAAEHERLLLEQINLWCCLVSALPGHLAISTFLIIAPQRKPPARRARHDLRA